MYKVFTSSNDRKELFDFCHSFQRNQTTLPSELSPSPKNSICIDEPTPPSEIGSEWEDFLDSVS